MSMRGGEIGAGGMRSQMGTARSKSVMDKPTTEEEVIDPAKGRTGTALKALHDKQKAQQQAVRWPGHGIRPKLPYWLNLKRDLCTVHSYRYTLRT